MSYLGRTRKSDLILLAQELGEIVTSDMKMVDLKNLILNSKAYEEEFVKGVIETIVQDRVEKERLEQEKERLEQEKENKRMEYEFNLKKLEIEAAANSNGNERQFITRINEEGDKPRLELRKLMQNFTVKDGDISFYLILFERQAKQAQIKEEDWVSHLLGLLPLEMSQIIARESDEVSNNYDYVKKLLLKRFKLSPEAFRRKFMQHQKSPTNTWRDFGFELTNYFEEWVTGLGIDDFSKLKKLMIVNQMKQRVSPIVREHFIDEWAKITSVTHLAEKLDEYESVRESKITIKSTIDRANKNWSKDQVYPNNRKNFTNVDVSSCGGNKEFINTKFGMQNKQIICFTCGRAGHPARLCRSGKPYYHEQSAKIQNVNTNNRSIEERKEPCPDNLTRSTNKLVKREMQQEGKGIGRENRDEAFTAKINGELLNFDNKDKRVRPKLSDLKIIKIMYNGRIVEAVLDTGAQISVFRKSLIHEMDTTGRGTIKLQPAFGDSIKADLIEVQIGLVCNTNITPTIKTIVAACEDLNVNILLDCETHEALLEQAKLYDPNLVMMLAKDEEKLPNIVDQKDKENEEHGEDARDSTENKITSDRENETNIFWKQQKSCETLKEAWRLSKANKSGFYIVSGMLHHEECVDGRRIQQLVVPLDRRHKILEIAHESVYGAHMGAKKTIQRVRYSFYWPGMIKDIKEYCSSCHGCQCRKVIRAVDKIPITPVIRPELPFQIVNVDLIGPIEPISSRGHKYILCLMDQHSRWPEAIPLKSLTAKATCDVLLEIFCRTGIPEAIVMDNAKNFTGSLTGEFLKHLGASPRFSTPYHPEGNGLVERWNQTFKNMLHHIIREEGRNWDRHIAFLLWAYREVPNTTTGVPPFLLMYGRDPRGPLSVLKSTWTGEIPLPLNIKKSTINYLQELRTRLEKATRQAKLISQTQQENYAKHYNLRRKHKEFKAGDNVLALIPDSTNKLYARWTGPVRVVRRVYPNSYYIEVNDGHMRLVHVNKLREYKARIQTIGVVFENDEEFGEIYETPNMSSLKGDSNLVENVDLRHLSAEQEIQLRQLLIKYENMFLGNIRRAKVGEHVIKLKGNVEDMKPKSYKIPETLKHKVDEQIEELVELKLIEPSISEIAHPVVCVHKKDGTIRLCIDFRSLNAITEPDAYPMQNITELNFLVGRKKFISVLDMLKGYWAIPMEEKSKEFTTFRTHRGQYKWNVLPFGLKNAAATYQRAMSKVIESISDFACAYIDDLAVFSDTWDEHLQHLEIVLDKLEKLNFSVSLKKCDFAKDKVKYLGHIIGAGKYGPDPERIQAVQELKPPKTKKQLRSALGLCNYYRQFIPNFATIALPLTELTKKKVPNEIPWTEEVGKAFERLKDTLCKITALQVPDIKKPYYLYTDASQYAIGCCLGQTNDENNVHPIAFGSQKLHGNQQKWSTIEREAFAIIWALQRFETFLFGAKIYLKTDHNPLVFLTNSAPQSPRLQRWALAIQRHNIEASHVKGSKLLNADALSRL